jgi:hypothetical protein
MHAQYVPGPFSSSSSLKEGPGYEARFPFACVVPTIVDTNLHTITNLNDHINYTNRFVSRPILRLLKFQRCQDTVRARLFINNFARVTII